MRSWVLRNMVRSIYDDFTTILAQENMVSMVLYAFIRGPTRRPNTKRKFVANVGYRLRVRLGFENGYIRRGVIIVIIRKRV